MTREIADILIRQTVESDYEIERKIKLIERIERLVIKSGMTAADAKTMLQNGASVRETEEATGLSHRQVSRLSKELNDNAIEPKGDIFTDEVIDNTSDHTTDNANDHSEEALKELNKVCSETPQESAAALNKQEETKPVRRIIPNNEQDDLHKLREAEIASFMPPLPDRDKSEKLSTKLEARINQYYTHETSQDNLDAFASFLPPLPERTEAEKVKAEPPAVREAPVDDKLKKLMEQAPALMSEPAWKTFEAMYRRGQTYEELCNTWDYFHKTQPADWQERPQ